jgi:hypothetical protein
VTFGRLGLKAYTKGERVLRIEATCHNAAELGVTGCGRILDKLPDIVARLAGMAQRFWLSAWRIRPSRCPGVQTAECGAAPFRPPVRFVVLSSVRICDGSDDIAPLIGGADEKVAAGPEELHGASAGSEERDGVANVTVIGSASGDQFRRSQFGEGRVVAIPRIPGLLTR